MYDYFVAQLHCPVCGRVSEPTSETGMQTKIRPVADGSYLGVGAETGATEEDVASHYVRLRAVRRDEPLHIVRGWRCEGNHSAFSPRYLWAEIVIDAGKIVSIVDAPLNRITLEHAHYLDDDIESIVRRMLGIELAPGGNARPDSIDLILKAVPMEERAIAASE